MWPPTPSWFLILVIVLVVVIVILLLFFRYDGSFDDTDIDPAYDEDEHIPDYVDRLNAKINNPGDHP